MKELTVLVPWGEIQVEITECMACSRVISYVILKRARDVSERTKPLVDALCVRFCFKPTPLGLNISVDIDSCLHDWKRGVVVLRSLFLRFAQTVPATVFITALLFALWLVRDLVPHCDRCEGCQGVE